MHGRTSTSLTRARESHRPDRSRYDPTIEDSYSVTRTIDGVTYSLALTDTAGQEEYRGLWSGSNLNSDAFLFVYDITQANSLQALEYFNTMIEVERETRYEHGKVLPVCIVAGNKCDLQGMRQIGARDGLEWAKSRGYGFMETSAREMVNIEETFARTYASISEREVEAHQHSQSWCGGYETPAETTRAASSRHYHPLLREHSLSSLCRRRTRRRYRPDLAATHKLEGLTGPRNEASGPDSSAGNRLLFDHSTDMAAYE